MCEQFIILLHLSSVMMAYTIPLPAYICQKGIRNVVPGQTSRLLPSIESIFEPVHSIYSSPASVLLTPVEIGQPDHLAGMHQAPVDTRPVSEYIPRWQTPITMLTLPLPAAEYFGK